jgi:indolepyruvate ferredoxin oxidoreductase beta subunit
MDSNRCQILVAGVGGQGVLFATKVILETARRQGAPVIGSETHGMSQRGGSVVSQVKVGPFANPLVGPGSADTLLALERTETYRTVSFLRAGGACIVNAPDIDFLDRDVADALAVREVRLLHVDGDRIGREIAAPVAANLVCLGFAAAAGALPFAMDAWTACIREITPDRFLAKNMEAFERGAQEAVVL